jgi:hypothetical protein
MLIVPLLVFLCSYCLLHHDFSTLFIFFSAYIAHKCPKGNGYQIIHIQRKSHQDERRACFETHLNPSAVSQGLGLGFTSILAGGVDVYKHIVYGA